jgi:hypothetical protein
MHCFSAVTKHNPLNRVRETKFALAMFMGCSIGGSIRAATDIID